MFNRSLWQLFYLLTTTFYLIACKEKCVTDNHEQYLASKTPYRIVANRNATAINYKGCTPLKFWSLVRHGTRNPNLKLIEKMRERLPEIRDLILENIPTSTAQIHNSDLDAFRKWSTKLGDKDEKRLTHEGQDEMLLLAERMQIRFPSVLTNIYSNTSYQFKYTATQRTKKSAHYFAAGLFGRNVVKDIQFPQPLKRDPILRFYKLCSKWRREISKNPESLKERRRFETSPVMSRTIKDINERLGLSEELDLSDIHTMYMVCAFETAWNKRKKSPWCSPFIVDNLKVMEYAEDLKYYWVDGYGYELTYKQACPAFNDLVEHFESKDAFPKAVVYFTHSGTLLKMLAHLELYKEDRHLKWNDFGGSADRRKWRASEIDAFGTNLAFVLYNCDNTPKVLVLHQEEIVRLPSCPDSDLCELEEIIKYYRDSVEECEFDEMCLNDPDDV